MKAQITTGLSAQARTHYDLLQPSKTALCANGHHSNFAILSDSAFGIDYKQMRHTPHLFNCK